MINCIVVYFMYSTMINLIKIGKHNLIRLVYIILLNLDIHHSLSYLMTGSTQSIPSLVFPLIPMSKNFLDLMIGLLVTDSIASTTLIGNLFLDWGLIVEYRMACPYVRRVTLMPYAF